MITSKSRLHELWPGEDKQCEQNDWVDLIQSEAKNGMSVMSHTRLAQNTLQVRRQLLKSHKLRDDGKKKRMIRRSMIWWEGIRGKNHPLIGEGDHGDVSRREDDEGTGTRARTIFRTAAHDELNSEGSDIRIRNHFTPPHSCNSWFRSCRSWWRRHPTTVSNSWLGLCSSCCSIRPGRLINLRSLFLLLVQVLNYFSAYGFSC